MASIRVLYQRVKRLKEFELFESLPEQLIWQLANYTIEQTIKKDTTILRPFTKSEKTYFLLKGEVEVEKYEDLAPHNSKSSLKTLNTMCGPIKIKSYRNNSNIVLLKSGDTLGVDANVVKRGIFKPYLSSCFAKTKTSCEFYIIELKILASTFQNLQKHCLQKLLTLHSTNLFLSLDQYTNNESLGSRKISYFKPNQSNFMNTPISRQHTNINYINHPRNKSCLENYSHQKSKLEKRKQLHQRTGSKDQMDQNVSYYIHNLIVKKIRKQNQRDKQNQRERQNEKQRRRSSQFNRILISRN